MRHEEADLAKTGDDVDRFLEFLDREIDRTRRGTDQNDPAPDSIDSAADSVDPAADPVDAAADSADPAADPVDAAVSRFLQQLRSLEGEQTESVRATAEFRCTDQKP